MSGAVLLNRGGGVQRSVLSWLARSVEANSW
jgi:hypothetical protein